ncbi:MULTISPECIES: helix-turn-helix domain-containing protein [unclassified Luteococcus]|uniref:helix-turn-helix domain-containing protein n=1 Tax=unclassified Luteococcus TaxID=2639923 RepID=UPI00313B32FB
MDIRNHIELGREVARLRAARGLTQAELAAQAHVSRRWLIQVESGHPGAQVDKLFAVLRALSVHVDLIEHQAPAGSQELLALVENQEW